MKKEEKTKKTRKQILDAAIKEFGSKNYDTASINSICSIGKISKGLVYHNFKGKDDLYLQCVKICFDEMTKTLKSQSFSINNPKEDLKRFLMIRQIFLEENPYYANIFFNAVLQPPKKLDQEIKEIRRELDEYLSQRYLCVLDKVTLRNGITRKVALDYFLATTEMFNRYFQKQSENIGEYRTLIQDHEERITIMFDIMLYGVAKEYIEK